MASNKSNTLFAEISELEAVMNVHRHNNKAEKENNSAQGIKKPRNNNRRAAVIQEAAATYDTNEVEVKEEQHYPNYAECLAMVDNFTLNESIIDLSVKYEVITKEQGCELLDMYKAKIANAEPAPTVKVTEQKQEKIVDENKVDQKKKAKTKKLAEKAAAKKLAEEALANGIVPEKKEEPKKEEPKTSEKKTMQDLDESVKEMKRKETEKVKMAVGLALTSVLSSMIDNSPKLAKIEELQTNAAEIKAMIHMYKDDYDGLLRNYIKIEKNVNAAKATIALNEKAVKDEFAEYKKTSEYKEVLSQHSRLGIAKLLEEKLIVAQEAAVLALAGNEIAIAEKGGDELKVIKDVVFDLKTLITDSEKEMNRLFREAEVLLKEFSGIDQKFQIPSVFVK